MHGHIVIREMSIIKILLAEQFKFVINFGKKNRLVTLNSCKLWWQGPFLKLKCCLINRVQLVKCPLLLKMPNMYSIHYLDNN